MKILHVIANLAPRYGGPSKACVEMAEAVATLGHDVTIATTNQDGPGTLDVPLDHPVARNGVSIRYFPVQAPRVWSTSRGLAQFLADHVSGFNLVHIHSLYMFHSWVAGRLCRRHGIPYIIRPHGSLDPFIYHRHRFRKMFFETWFESENLKKAGAIHYTTSEEQRLAKPYVYGTPGFVAPLGLHMREFDSLPPRTALAARFPGLQGKPVVLFLGRINFKKGLDVLAKTFAKVLKSVPNAMLVIAGPEDPGYGDRVRRWLQQCGVLDRTLFTGMLLGPAKLEAFTGATVFVLPSYSENFGLSVIEALACGTPVVLSTKVNVAIDVVHANAGLAVEASPDLLAAALNRLLQDPQSSMLMGQRGREWARNTYNWDHIGKQLELQYGSVIRSRQVSHS